MTQPGQSDIEAAVEEVRTLDGTAGHYLAIGFLEGLATGMRLYSSADRVDVSDRIREQALELRELVP